MKKIKKFFSRRTWIFVLIACIVFIPQSFTYQAKLNMRVLVTGLAIDKAGEEYEVTAQVIMPSAGSETGGSGARLDFISEKGESVSEGIQKIAYKIGKTAGLSHTSFVIVGESMLEDNLSNSLDFFARDAQVSPSIMLLISNGSAKETIKETGNLELSVGVGLQKVFIYKEGSLNGIVMPIEEFINASFGIAKSSLAGGVLIAPEGKESLGDASSQSSDSGGQVSSSSSGGDGQSGSDNSTNRESQSKNARIKFYNDIYYFKNGKYINKFNEEKEILGVYLANKKNNNGEMKISNVNGGLLTDAIVGIQFTNKKAKQKIKIKNGKPVCVFNITIRDVKITEINNKDKPNINLYNRKDTEMLKSIEEKLKEEISENIIKAFEKAKVDNVDIFDIGELAYRTKHKEWKKYYEEMGENYLKDVNIEVNVKIKNIN